MVAPRRVRKVFCTVVRVPQVDDRKMNASNRFSNRPSDLLPWADPYIARLVTKLQNEVRNERAQVQRNRRLSRVMQMELDPPSPCPDVDWEWNEEPRWNPGDSDDWSDV